MAIHLTLIDYGVANLLNVARALEHCGAVVSVTCESSDVVRAERLVVPGVGAFEGSIREMRDRGFAEEVKRFIDTQRPVLGICVGMQMLFDASEEFGLHAGLGILPGRVQPIPSTTTQGERLRVPHIGWNHLVPPDSGRSWDDTLLASLREKQPAVYFVHSFVPVPENASDRLADCVYGGHRLCAAIQRDNLMATQFHPERSGETGLAVLRRFLEM